MKVLAIIGSPRPSGNTYHAVKQIEARLKEKASALDVEYFQLSRANIAQCKGCYACIEKGEAFCPLKDGREELEMKIRQADAVIFGSPVYTYNVSWIMKNMLDRFAYRCHRPDFQGKKAMVVITTGSVGLWFVGSILSSMIETMGFVVIAKAGITYAPPHEKNEKKVKRELVKLNRKTDLFYKRVLNSKPAKPSFVQMLSFRMQQKAFAKAPVHSADYQFWFAKGWFDKTCAFYYPVSGAKLKKLSAAFLSKLMPS